MTDLEKLTKEELLELLKKKTDSKEKKVESEPTTCSFQPRRATDQAICSEKVIVAYGTSFYCKKHNTTVQALKAKKEWEIVQETKANIPPSNEKDIPKPIENGKQETNPPVPIVETKTVPDEIPPAENTEGDTEIHDQDQENSEKDTIIEEISPQENPPKKSSSKIPPPSEPRKMVQAKKQPEKINKFSKAKSPIKKVTIQEPAPKKAPVAKKFSTIVQVKKSAKTTPMVKNVAKKAPIVSTPTKSAPKVITKKVGKNFWGRYEESDTHILFDFDTKEAYGVQESTGSIRALSEKDINICKRNKWPYKVMSYEEEGEEDDQEEALEEEGEGEEEDEGEDLEEGDEGEGEEDEDEEDETLENEDENEDEEDGEEDPEALEDEEEDPEEGDENEDEGEEEEEGDEDEEDPEEGDENEDEDEEDLEEEPEPPKKKIPPKTPIKKSIKK